MGCQNARRVRWRNGFAIRFFAGDSLSHFVVGEASQRVGYVLTRRRRIAWKLEAVLVGEGLERIAQLVVCRLRNAGLQVSLVFAVARSSAIPYRKNLTAAAANVVKIAMALN